MKIGKISFPIGAVISVATFVILLYLGLWPKIFAMHWCVWLPFCIGLVLLFFYNFKINIKSKPLRPMGWAAGPGPDHEPMVPSCPFCGGQMVEISKGTYCCHKRAEYLKSKEKES